MPRRTEDALLPLLALAECAALIDHLAATGTVEREALGHVIDCLCGRRDLPGSSSVKAADYPIGLAVLEDLLGGSLPENQQRIEDYMRSLIRLERKLARRPAMLAVLRAKLEEARGRQALAMPAANVHAVLAGIYADTLGLLKPSLSVIGSWRQISDRDNANMIRTLILGGVQAASLWRAAGGRWWLLKFRRRAVLRTLAGFHGP